MNGSRRSFLLLGFPLGLLAVRAAAQKGGLKGRMPTLTGGQMDRQYPSNSPGAPPPDPRAALQERQAEIKKQVQQLYGLASQLKAEIDQTDSADVLSLQVLKKAEQIQKIAKQIQSLARG